MPSSTTNVGLVGYSYYSGIFPEYLSIWKLWLPPSTCEKKQSDQLDALLFPMDHLVHLESKEQQSVQWKRHLTARHGKSLNTRSRRMESGTSDTALSVNDEDTWIERRRSDRAMLTKMPSGCILGGKVWCLWRWYRNGDRAKEVSIRLTREGTGPFPPACGVLFPLMGNGVLPTSGNLINEVWIRLPSDGKLD